MTSADSGPPPAPRVPSWGLFYKGLCFALLAAQGGALDAYLLLSGDLYWLSWIVTDLVVASGWGLFFARNARDKRERACGFHRKGSPREFTYAYLAWLVHVMACASKAAVILGSDAAAVAAAAPLGVAGFEAVALLSAPLLFCLIHAVAEDPNGAGRHRSLGCFASTCLDLVDSLSLMEALLRRELPAPHLEYAVASAHLAAQAAPVSWLYELAASELRCGLLWARLLAALLVNAPLLAVRCFQVFAHGKPVSVFVFKNAFFLASRVLELAEQCAAVRGGGGGGGGVRGGRSGGARDLQARFSRGVSDNDMCPHGYVNTLAVAQS